MSKLPVRLPSYVAAALLSEHADAEATTVGATTATATAYYSTVSPGETILSASITLTKKSMVVVIALNINRYSSKVADIKRSGVVKTKETTISAANFTISAAYAHLQYATEILDPGTYTYDLVLTYTSSIAIYGACIKIVAVTCS
jgi:hypothetical protein